MTIYSVTAGLQPPAMSVASSPIGQLRTTVLSAVAGTLNTSVADVQGRLRAGQTLADLARTVGMSQDEFTASISAAVAGPGRVSAELPVDEVVQRIADQRKKAERTSTAPKRPSGRVSRGSGGSGDSGDSGGSAGGTVNGLLGSLTGGATEGTIGRLLDVEL